MSHAIKTQPGAVSEYGIWLPRFNKARNWIHNNETPVLRTGGWNDHLIEGFCAPHIWRLASNKPLLASGDGLGSPTNWVPANRYGTRIFYNDLPYFDGPYNQYSYMHAAILHKNEEDDRDRMHRVMTSKNGLTVVGLWARAYNSNPNHRPSFFSINRVTAGGVDFTNQLNAGSGDTLRLTAATSDGTNRFQDQIDTHGDNEISNHMEHGQTMDFDFGANHGAKLYCYTQDFVNKKHRIIMSQTDQTGSRQPSGEWRFQINIADSATQPGPDIGNITSYDNPWYLSSRGQDTASIFDHEGSGSMFGALYDKGCQSFEEMRDLMLNWYDHTFEHEKVISPYIPPVYGPSYIRTKGLNITVADSAMDVTQVPPGGGQYTLRISNRSDSDATIKFGTSTTANTFSLNDIIEEALLVPSKSTKTYGPLSLDSSERLVIQSNKTNVNAVVMGKDRESHLVRVSGIGPITP